jgi:hypothetical protein
LFYYLIIEKVDIQITFDVEAVFAVVGRFAHHFTVGELVSGLVREPGTQSRQNPDCYNQKD